MAIQTLRKLRDLFVEQSTDISKRLGYVRESHRSGVDWGSMRLGEEAITNLLLLDLFEQGSTVLHFTQASRRHESVSGVDFELWIGSESTGWFRFAIQAKKIDPKANTGRYSSLRHETPTGNQQIDLLEDYARVKQAAPIYFLYNHTADAGAEHWHCCTKEPADITLADLQELGCTMTPSINIRNAIDKRGTRTFDSIHKNEDTLPLKCLLCPEVLKSAGFTSASDSTEQERDMPTLSNPRSYYHRTIPRALLEKPKDAVENERGGSRISLSGDNWDADDGAMDGPSLQARSGVGRPKAVAVIEVDELGSV